MSPKEREVRLQQAMFSLVSNSNFKDFIDHLRDVREYNVKLATTEKTLSDKRLLQTYLGTVCAYGEIIEMYDAFIEDIARRASEAQESAS